MLLQYIDLVQYFYFCNKHIAYISKIQTDVLFVAGARRILNCWKKLEGTDGSKQGILYQYICSVVPNIEPAKGSCAYGLKAFREFMEGKEEFATGTGCLEAGLALSMAAWNNDMKMIDLLIAYGAPIPATNSLGRNVFHSLVEVMLNIHVDIYYTCNLYAKRNRGLMQQEKLHPRIVEGTGYVLARGL